MTQEVPMSAETIPVAPGVDFVPVARLDDGHDAVAVDYARSKGRWAALPDSWLPERAMCAELMRVSRIPEWDGAAGQALLAAMADFLEVRGSGRAREYRKLGVLPAPMTPAEIMQAETARLAEVERALFERELHAREAQHADRDKVVLDGNRQLHRELADEYTVPMIRALEARVAGLERQLAQHGELEAVGTASTPAPTAIEAPAAAESRLARARRFMFGDMEPAEIERLLEQDEDDGEDD
jgi:hypothetical protein